MTKPLNRKTTHAEPIKTTIRLAPAAHAELQAAADLNGRSMNAELMARIYEDPSADLRREVAELKGMVSEVLRIMRDHF